MKKKNSRGVYFIFKDLFFLDRDNCTNEVDPQEDQEDDSTTSTTYIIEDTDVESTSSVDSDSDQDNQADQSGLPDHTDTNEVDETHSSLALALSDELGNNCPTGWSCSKTDDSEMSYKFGSSVALSDDGRRAVIMSKYNTQIFDTEKNSFVSIHEIDWKFNWFDHGNFVSMAGDGKHIAVGGKDNETECEVAHFYEESPSVWKKSSMYRTVSGRFGASISLPYESLKRVLVGAHHWSEAKGQALIYDHDIDPKKKGEFNLVPPILEGVENDDKFGVSTAISGNANRIAIGAKNSNDVKAKAGNVRIYEYSSLESTWKPLGVITGTKKFQRFGNQVEMSKNGSRLIVGSWKGFPEVWELNESQQEWVRCGNPIEPGEGIINTHRPGYSLDISNDGKMLVFSAPFYDSNRGRVFLYEEDPEEVCKWNKVQTLKGLDEEDDCFGSDVSLAGNGEKLLVGARGTGGNTKKGYAVLYQLPRKISIHVKTDNRPSDISWILESADEEILKSLDQGTYDEANHLYVHDVELAASDAGWKFSIYDDNSDGLCCETGNGYYRVYRDDKLILSGGVFEDVDVHRYERMIVNVKK